MAAGGDGDRYADETGTRSSTLLTISPEQVQIDIPSLIKGPVVVVASAVLFGVGAFIGFSTYPTLPDVADNRLTTTSWRITTDDSYINRVAWQVCALIPHSDDACKTLIDFSDATVTAVPALPGGWKDYNSKATLPGAATHCEGPWSAQSGGFDQTPYIEWKFPTATKVGCFKVQYTKVGYSSWSEAIPTIIEAEQDGKWVKQRTVKFGDQDHDSWSYLTTLPASYEEEAKDNPYKIASLAVAVVCTVLGVGAILVVLPLLTSELRSQKQSREALREEVSEGTAMVVTSTESQWAAFVEEQWGPGGIVHQEQMSWWLWVLTSLGLGTVATLLVKLKSFYKGYELAWSWCGLWGMGSSCLVIFILWAIDKVQRRRRYNFLKRGRLPAVLGTQSAYFGGILIRGSNLLASGMITAPTAAKTQLVVVYKHGNDDKKKVAMPVAENQVEDVKAFIRDHCNTYRWFPAVQQQRHPPTKAAAPCPSGPPACTGSVMMVAPTSVQAVERSSE